MPERIQRGSRGHMTTQAVGAETLIYDERRHMAFCLNESASAVWRLADGERTVAQVRAAVSIELGTQVSEEFVRFALEELSRNSLVEKYSIADPAPVISRRALLRTLGVSGALLLPMIAAVVAPPAAQAYNGCVDCASTPASRRTPPAAGRN